MKKLWQKNWQLDKTVELFETKGDLFLDQKLVKYDVFGSLAHAHGLEKLGILSSGELQLVKQGLGEVLKLEKEGNFVLQPGDEDVHTKIENFLTEKYGEIGKKIHTGRSRNDQVLTAIRLFTKDNILTIWSSTIELVDLLLDFASKHEKVLMPGYTHMQKAMPSSVGMWASAIAEGLLDDLILLKSAYEVNDQSPLGAAAAYGVPLPLDREYTAKLMGLSRVQINSLYTQNSRGKIESAVLAALTAIMTDINKLASDVLLFTTSEFGFFEISKELCSGSSIMPQKKNVDIAELLRSKLHVVLGNFVQLTSMSGNLISGYNRDLQDSKKPLFESLELVTDSLEVSKILVANISINIKKMSEGLTSEIFATHRALELVSQGMAFREAYKQVSLELDQAKEWSNKQSLAKMSTHIGGLGNLGLAMLVYMTTAQLKDVQSLKKKYSQATSNLLVSK